MGVCVCLFICVCTHGYKCMASSPITSWQMDGETVETVADFIFESEVAQLCPTLCDPVDCSPLGSSVHGTLQARILEWVAISFYVLP